MKICHNLFEFYITILFIINVFIKNINNHYIYKSINLRKSNEEQNVIEIEMKNNLQGNIQFINLNNDNNIDMYINDVKQTIFNNTIQLK